MTIESHGHEHELEPQYGLPERLPAGERLLWQGSPEFAAVALRIFHVRKAAIYFAVLMALRGAFAVAEGTPGVDALVLLAWPLVLAFTALACLLALAWMTAKTTVYTLTDKRLVLRIGIVLTLTFNIPLRTIQAAALRQGAQPCGDIVVQLKGPDHIAYFHLWPHARPWHLARPQPMLRAVPDAPRVAALLTQAWAAATAQQAPQQAAPAAQAAQATVLAPMARAAVAPDTVADAVRSTGSSPWQPSPT
jgi:hypothetical protein